MVFTSADIQRAGLRVLFTEYNKAIGEAREAMTSHVPKALATVVFSYCGRDARDVPVAFVLAMFNSPLAMTHAMRDNKGERLALRTQRCLEFGEHDLYIHTEIIEPIYAREFCMISHLPVSDVVNLLCDELDSAPSDLSRELSALFEQCVKGEFYRDILVHWYMTEMRSYWLNGEVQSQVDEPRAPAKP